MAGSGRDDGLHGASGANGTAGGARSGSGNGAGQPFALNDFQALDLWRRTLESAIRGEAADLTQRQLAILLTVYLTPPPHTVRALAARLGVSKPAVTRALDRLGVLGFVRRKPDEQDRRSVLVQRTVRGAVHMREFGAQIALAAMAVGRDPLGVDAFGGQSPGEPALPMSETRASFMPPPSAPARAGGTG
jgi:DNA-binding MarR family transcriptional regulator